MAQFNVRLPDAFYKQVQRIVRDHLEMDLSSFVRELFIDAILIYEDRDLPLADRGLAAIGQKHRLEGGPSVVLTMASHWNELDRLYKMFGHEYFKLSKLVAGMRGPKPETPEEARELVNALAADRLTPQKKREILTRNPKLAQVLEKLDAVGREMVEATQSAIKRKAR